MKKRTLLEIRNAAIADIITEEVEAFLTGERKRFCATRGRALVPRSRDHHFCSGPRVRGVLKPSPCRQAFYAGVFRPRPRD